MTSLSKEQIETLRKAKSVIESILENEDKGNVQKQNEEAHELRPWEKYPSVIKIFDNPQKATMSDLNKASWAMGIHGFLWYDIYCFYRKCLDKGVPFELVRKSVKYQKKHLVDVNGGLEPFEFLFDFFENEEQDDLDLDLGMP